MADDARRGVTMLTAMTQVLTVAVGVVINLATDGKHSWWAWVLVGVVTVVSVAVTVMLARRQGASDRLSRSSAGHEHPGRAVSVDVRGARVCRSVITMLRPTRSTIHPRRDGLPVVMLR